MATELLTSLGVFKSLYDSAKALRDMNDGAIRNAAVIELQEKILSAQEAQASLLEEVRNLEEKVASFETWETNKQRYELNQTSRLGGYAYVLKADAQGSEPPHQICANCYHNRKISILQRVGSNLARSSLGIQPTLKCFECKSEILG